MCGACELNPELKLLKSSVLTCYSPMAGAALQGLITNTSGKVLTQSHRIHPTGMDSVPTTCTWPWPKGFEVKFVSISKQDTLLIFLSNYFLG